MCRYPRVGSCRIAKAETMKIFVFGSNEQGIHGAGAAKVAKDRYGAIWGRGEGRMGFSYAIPTKFTPHRHLNLSDIERSVKKFLSYAKRNPDLEFQVTQIGCGRAGWTSKDIAPLFVKAPHNCQFDTKWQEFLPNGTIFWGSI